MQLLISNDMSCLPLNNMQLCLCLCQGFINKQLCQGFINYVFVYIFIFLTKNHRQIQTTETSIYLCITTILKGQVINKIKNSFVPIVEIFLRTCCFPLVYVYLQLSCDKDGLPEDISKAM